MLKGEGGRGRGEFQGREEDVGGERVRYRAIVELRSIEFGCSWKSWSLQCASGREVGRNRGWSPGRRGRIYHSVGVLKREDDFFFFDVLRSGEWAERAGETGGREVTSGCNLEG